MARVTKLVSDITGAEAAEDQFAQLVVRQHPKTDQAKRLDALPAELADLKEVGDLVILEVKLPDGTQRDMYVRYTEFSKLVSDDTVNKAPGIRGRQPGFSPRNGN